MSWITAGAQVFGGVIQAYGAGRAKRAARKNRLAAEAKIAELEASRQDIINPYAEAAQMLSNPFANVQVSTQAAEFQSEQQDIALANTLDTLRATGAGAGGATALARAATQGRAAVAADLSKQEARVQQLRAQGQAAMEKQLAMFSGAGNKFMFDAQEKREMQQLNRQSSLASSYSQQEASYGGQMMQGFGKIIGGVGAGALDMSINEEQFKIWQELNPGGTRAEFRKSR